MSREPAASEPSPQAAAAAPRLDPHQPILSFDVEEYFQVEAASRCVDPADWSSIPCRLPGCVDRILELLERSGSTATFFVLGWVARRQGRVVQAIAAAGHEIASHGMDHRMVHLLTPGALMRDLHDSRRLLEDIAGRPVRGYRAPTFSVNHDTAWALDVLVSAGFSYDSSVFPIHHDRYGVPDAPRRAHLAVGPGGSSLVELPPLTVRTLRVNVPVGGGGYFRLLPGWVLRRAIAAARREGHCAMIYLHPWEIDPHQPALKMPLASRLRHRLNLRGTEGKLARLLSAFRFCGAAQWIDSQTAPPTLIHHYGRARRAA